MKRMIFWGAAGQARVLLECTKNLNVNLVALFDNDESIKSPFSGIPIHYGKNGFENWLVKTEAIDSIGFLVAIGGDRGKDRVKIHEYLETSGLHPLTAIHPSAFVADDCEIGAGSQILTQSAVCVGTKIGRSCIVNTSASIDHECRLGDGVHVCPGARIAGCVEIGSFAMIGTGAVVLPRVRIGDYSVVGAGAVVVQDVPSNSVVVGIPARILRRGKANE